MLKVSADPGTGELVRLRLEGKLHGPWVAELRDSCCRILAAGSRLVLDLTDVSFVDLDGVALLRTLGRRGVVLHGPTCFVAEQLRGWAHAGIDD